MAISAEDVKKDFACLDSDQSGGEIIVTGTVPKGSLSHELNINTIDLNEPNHTVSNQRVDIDDAENDSRYSSLQSPSIDTNSSNCSLEDNGVAQSVAKLPHSDDKGDWSAKIKSGLKENGASVDAIDNNDDCDIINNSDMNGHNVAANSDIVNTSESSVVSHSISALSSTFIDNSSVKSLVSETEKVCDTTSCKLNEVTAEVTINVSPESDSSQSTSSVINADESLSRHVTNDAADSLTASGGEACGSSDKVTVSEFLRDFLDDDDDEHDDEHDDDMVTSSAVTTSSAMMSSDVSRQNRKRRFVFDMSPSSDTTSTDAANNPEETSHVKTDDDNDNDDDTSDAKDDYSLPAKRFNDGVLWREVQDVTMRELGASVRIPAAQMLHERVIASVKFVQSMAMSRKLEKHQGCVNCLHFNDSGNLLASGSDDLNIVLWNCLEGKPFLVFDSGHRSNVFQTKFLPFSGDCHLISCSRDGQIRLAELSGTGVCKSTRKLGQHRGAAHKLALLNDSAHVIYSCGEDAVVNEIDVRVDKPNKLCITKYKDKKIALYSIQSNPFNSNEFCVGGRDPFIRIYDKRMIKESENDGIVTKYCPHHLVENSSKSNVTCAVYNYNGTEVIGTYNDEDIYLFDTSHSEGAEHVHKYQGHRNSATVKGVNFYGPKSEFIVSGSDCGNVFFWEKQSEAIVQYFHADDGGVVNVLEPHPHLPILATSGLDHDVKIWEPIIEKKTDLKGLKKVMKANKKERDDVGAGPPDIDGQMLWFIMHQLRRAARRQTRDEAENAASSNSSSSLDSDDDSDQPEEGPSEPVQCTTS